MVVRYIVADVMDSDGRITVRLDDENLAKSLERAQETYDLNESQVVRHCLRLGTKVIEEEGLDALVDRTEAEGAADA